MDISVSKYPFYVAAQNFTLFSLIFGLIRSTAAVYFGNEMWALIILNIIVYGIGCIGFFKDIPDLLLPSCPWLLYELLVSVVCLDMAGQFDNMFVRIKQMTTEEARMKLFGLLGLYSICLVCYFQSAIILTYYCSIRSEQKTKNHRQKRNQQAKRDFGISNKNKNKMDILVGFQNFTLFSLIFGLIRSTAAVYFGNEMWALSVLNIIIYGIGCIAFFKDKPKLLLPSIVWLPFELIFSVLCLNLVGYLTIEDLRINFLVFLYIYSICFVCYWASASALCGYFAERMEQKTENHRQIQNQQAKRDFGISILVEAQCEIKEEKS